MQPLSKNSKATALVAYTQPANIETILEGAVSIMSEDVLPTIKTLNATGYADLLEDVPLQAMVSEGEFEVSYPIFQISQQPIEWKQFDVNFDPTMLHVEIYNAKKDMYESVSTSPWQQTKNIDSYVTETQEILFKLRATSEYINSYVELPTFTLKGVAKND